MKKMILPIMLIVFLTFTVSSYSLKLIKIGFVDVEEVFNTYPGTGDIRDKLKKERDKYQVEIDKQKAEIARLENDYQLNSSKLSEDERQRRSAEIEYKKEVLSEYIDDTNSKLNALKDELSKPIYLKIANVIRKVSAEKGFSFVFKKGSESLLYQDKEFDLTQEIKSRLTKELSIEDRN